MAGSPPKPKFPYDKKPVGRPTVKPPSSKPTNVPKVKPLPPVKPPQPPKPVGKVKLPGKPRIPKPGMGVRTPKA